MTSSKWAPSRCDDCINAIAKMALGTAQERTAAFEAYSPFLKGLASFVERVGICVSFHLPVRLTSYLVITAYAVALHLAVPFALL